VTPEDVERVTRTAARVGNDTDLSAQFYALLFSRHPELRPLFPVDMVHQMHRFVDELGALAVALPELGGSRRGPTSWGARHVGYGVRHQHYPMVRDALLDALAAHLAPDFDEADRQSWELAFNLLAEIMRRRRAGREAQAMRDSPASTASVVATPDCVYEDDNGLHGFSGLAERHRRELHVHCYRMLGSFEDAEDTVQETFLRAWRRRETFEGRSTFRAWLYRIATNACLDLLAKRRPEPATGGEVLWLQPYPDRLLDELPAGDADEPETVAVARETIELAYLVAVQHLAPRPRAVLILRDVLGWPAKDVAELLGDSVNSVNSALQRARAGMREHLPAERQDWTGGEEDAGTRELVRRYTDASVATDVAGLAALLRDDVRCSMPPTPGLYVGRDAVVNDWVESGFEA
jgi:RNA polymerase sigma-70 factor (ECF subfamily)